MASCKLAPEDKKAYGKEVGEILVKNHGKKKFYSPEEAKPLHPPVDLPWIGIVGLCVSTPPRAISRPTTAL